MTDPPHHTLVAAAKLVAAVATLVVTTTLVALAPLAIVGRTASPFGVAIAAVTGATLTVVFLAEVERAFTR